ncbi:MAG TPA: retropepsin-like aspartic protease [Candidatus Lokiarchaeia archaeon]|nr:retropepsin-like aspartic protease [Candidatus Lokiarchaeia archaeon]
MGRITRNLNISGSRGKTLIKSALFDGGASHSFIRMDTCTAIGDLIPFKDEHGKKVTKPITLADGETRLLAIGTCTFDTKVNDIDIRDEAWVVEKLGQELIIGADTLQRYGIQLEYAEKEAGGGKIVTEARDEIAWL